MKKRTNLKILTGVLFCFFVAIGISIAVHKPLWMDELHTQFYYIQRENVAGMMTGQTFREGNNAPLFYVLQKWVAHVPAAQVTEEMSLEGIWIDAKKQIVLRLNAIVFMSLALAFLFYFFTVEFGALAGVYALLCALASPMVWLYWAEARPYPLVLLLTVFQCAALIKIWQGLGKNKAAWYALSWVHVLLAFTSYLAAIQIACAAAVLFCSRQRVWKRSWLVFVLPLAIAFYYRWQCVKTPYALAFEWKYILENIPLDRFAFYGIGALMLALMFRMRKAAGIEGKTALSFWKFFVLVLVAVGSFLAAIMPYSQQGYFPGFHSRFLIFLTPIGIVAQVLLARHIFRLAVNDLWCAVSLIFVTVFLSVIAFSHTAGIVFSYLRYL